PVSFRTRSGASHTAFALTLVDARTLPLDTVRAAKKTGRGRHSVDRGPCLSAVTATLSRNLRSAPTFPQRAHVGNIQAPLLARSPSSGTKDGRRSRSGEAVDEVPGG